MKITLQEEAMRRLLPLSPFGVTAKISAWQLPFKSFLSRILRATERTADFATSKAIPKANQ